MLINKFSYVRIVSNKGKISHFNLASEEYQPGVCDMDFALLAAECAPWVATQTMAAIVRTKSQFNPFKFFWSLILNKKIFLILLLLAIPQVSFADDACKLYLCLMGASESDGGTECEDSIKDYTDKFKKSCPNLPTCIGTKVGVLSKGISYIAGYNLRMLPIIQSPKQLVEVYGEDVAQTFTTIHFSKYKND